MENKDSDAIRNSERREGRLLDLQQETIKDFVNSKNEDEAKMHLFEFAFLDFAWVQISVEGDRLRRESDSEEMMERLTNSKSLLEQINKGDWKKAKDIFEDEIKGFTPEFFGFDEDEQERWERLIEEKIALINDKTDPYVYPNIEQLKAKVTP